MTPKELKEYRKELGFTVKEMADKLNTPKRTYEHWEYGTRRIPGMLEMILEKYSIILKKQ